MAEDTSHRSVAEIEADLDATRERLARSVEELAHRVSPAELKRRQSEAVREKVNETFYTPAGDLRYEVVATILGGVAAVTLLLGGARRLFYKG